MKTVKWLDTCLLIVIAGKISKTSVSSVNWFSNSHFLLIKATVWAVHVVGEFYFSERLVS